MRVTTNDRAIDAGASRSGMHSPLLSIGVGLIIATLPGAVRAATYTGTVGAEFVPDTTVVTPEPASYHIVFRGSTAAVTMSEANHGTIDARADTTGGYGYSVGARGQIEYSFTVAGDPDIFVPVRVQAHGYAEGSGEFPAGSYGFFDAQAIFTLSYYGPRFFPYGDSLMSKAHAEGAYSGPRVDTDEFNLDQVVLIRSNYRSAVSLVAAAGAFGLGATAHAFIDPTFTIDPAYASRFTIVGLPGEVPPPAGTVPEVSSWAMMVVGFAILGRTMRCRRAKLTVTADTSYGDRRARSHQLDS